MEEASCPFMEFRCDPMAFCTQCAARFRDEDMGAHKCNPADIPESGKEITASGAVFVQPKKVE